MMADCTPSHVIPKRQSESDVATSFLLHLLTLELTRNGGAGLVTRLKDEVKEFHNLSGKRLNSLLLQSNVAKPKLMAFLESHDTVFHVDRKKEPHWVTLYSGPTTSALAFPHFHVKNTQNQSFMKECLTQDTAIGTVIQTQLQAQVYHKALYVLRKRHARMVRRQRADIAPTQDYSLESDLGVHDHWLLRQCSWEVHSYLRSTGFYLEVYPTPQHVKPVGSREWETVVMPKFHQALHVDGSEIEVSHETATLRIRQQASKDNNNFANHGEPHAVDTEDIHTLKKIDLALTELVLHKDGGHQVSLSLLLHRHPSFRQLLGGRDLWRLYTTYSNDSFLFQDISMFCLDDEIILRSKRSKCFITAETTVCDGIGDGESSTAWTKRMKVDEEGLFSITNRKCGRAMANLVIQACRKTRIFENDRTEDCGMERPCRIAIDLTASVGGMTLGLAKANFFDRINAYEIDKTRAVLCQENMREHGCADVVNVFNEDSVKAIQSLPRNVCMVIDPPWGGYNYKKLKGSSRFVFKLGASSLEDVLQSIAHNNSPCVVGVRLPVSYAVESLLNGLRAEGRDVQFEVFTARRIGVQLFLVLFFPDPS
jgi:hypothetical protein